MLSVEFTPENEWWVSGRVFDRLFEAGLALGNIPSSMRHYIDVAAANGGLTFSLMEPSEATKLTVGLRQTAQAELAKLINVDPKSHDEGYRLGLLDLLHKLAVP